MLRCMSNCAVMTCINTGISTRGPNRAASVDSVSSCPSRTLGSLPFLPLLLTISNDLFWIELGVRSSSFSFPLSLASSSALALSFAASSFARLRSSDRPALSFVTFSVVTTVRLSQRARPLSSPSAPPATESSSEESEEESESQFSESSESSPESSESESESLSLLAAFFFFLGALLSLLLLELPSSSLSSSSLLLELLELSSSSLASLSLMTGFFLYSAMMPL
mmetsp:Transcript_35940/g.86768  ORF Transcript_35940/g.86768 Transcript_35940/m.86768 type:complete len:224 (+) Transcript_35940:166-837(+)